MNNNHSHLKHRCKSMIVPRGLIILLLAGLLLACSSMDLLKGNTPEGVTERFYTALQKNDQDAMLDCIDPDLRASVDPYGSIGLYGVDWIRIILEKLEGRRGKKIIELTKMRYEVLDNDGTTAHVRVYGRIRIVDIGLVREFQFTHTVIRKDGNWYLSSPR